MNFSSISYNFRLFTASSRTRSTQFEIQIFTYFDLKRSLVGGFQQSAILNAAFPSAQEAERDHVQREEHQADQTERNEIGRRVWQLQIIEPDQNVLFQFEATVCLDQYGVLLLNDRVVAAQVAR